MTLVAICLVAYKKRQENVDVDGGLVAHKPGRVLIMIDQSDQRFSSRQRITLSSQSHGTTLSSRKILF